MCRAIVIYHAAPLKHEHSMKRLVFFGYTNLTKLSLLYNSNLIQFNQSTSNHVRPSPTTEQTLIILKSLPLSKPTTALWCATAPDKPTNALVHKVQN